jgi:hypothetical protein
MELRLNGKYQKMFYMRIKVVNTHNNSLSFFPFVGSTTTNPIQKKLIKDRVRIDKIAKLD